MGEGDVELLRRRLVSDASDDLLGVYEVLWDANGMWPEKPCSERLRIAEDAVVAALDAGLVRVEVGTWKETEVVSNEDARRLLLDWNTWAVPDGPTVFLWSEAASGDSA